MVVLTSFSRLFGFDALTVWPFIFIVKQHKNNHALIEHEKVHYTEQRDSLLFPWLIQYCLSDRFRFNAEVRGHAVQVKLGGGTLQWAAFHIATKYDTGRTVEQAESALKAELQRLET